MITTFTNHRAILGARGAVRSLHMLNAALWLCDAVVSLAWAHSMPLGIIGALGTCLAGVMFWIEP